MTRDEAKEAAMVMLAYANGEQVQVQLADGSWIDFPINPHFDWNHVNYRIKPKPAKYRPFESQEECRNEMHKHPDFGWIIAKDSKIMYHIYVIGIGHVLIDSMSISFPETFAEYEFTDGTPFGIKEE